MVSQIVWLGVRDVFTQIANDVVGQGLDHGRRSPRGLLHNQGGVSGRTTAFSDVTEGKEKQKPASHMERIGQPEVDLATIERRASLCARCYIYSRVFFVTNVFDAFPLLTETERNALVIEDFS
ncbi:hypothetical protein YC2023_052520 [Brassica napus]